MPSLEEEEEERAVFDDVDDFSQDEDDDLDDDDDDLDDDDDGLKAPAALQQQQPSAESAPLPDPIQDEALPAVASPASAANATVGGDEEEGGRGRALEERQRAFEESRRLFQRLWTEEDEVVILQGFHDFVTGRGTVHASHQHDTGPFYHQIRVRLQLDFTKNQLIEKLRRLKKKFRNVVSRMASAGPAFSFKSAHEKTTFDIARRIWSSHLKRGRDFTNNDDLLGLPICPPDDAATRPRRRGRKRLALADAPPDPSAASAPPLSLPSPQPAAPPQQPPNPSSVSVLIEDTVRSCLSPFFKELLDSVLNGSCRPATSSPALGLIPPGLGGNTNNPLTTVAAAAHTNNDDKWRKQQILELEVYAKRIELVQDQIKSTLEELRSVGN